MCWTIKFFLRNYYEVQLQLNIRIINKLHILLLYIINKHMKRLNKNLSLRKFLLINVKKSKEECESIIVISNNFSNILNEIRY